MTPEQRALHRQVLGLAGETPPAEAAAPPEPEPAPKPRPQEGQQGPSEATLRLVGSLPASMREAFVPVLSGSPRKLDPQRQVASLGQTMQTQEAVKDLDRPRTPAAQVPAALPPRSSESADLPALRDPEIQKAMRALEAEGYDPDVQGGPNDDRAAVGEAEFGVQPRRNLRLMPLQKLSGEYAISPNAVKEALKLKYFARIQKREKLPGIDQMTPEQYQQTMAAAEEEASRFVAGVVGGSEQSGNMLVPMQSTEDRALAVRRGEDLPLWGKVAAAGPLLGSHLREYLGGRKVEDQAITALMAPLWALARPGQVATGQSLDEAMAGGSPVEREGKFSWVTRLGPLAAIGSWFFDPALSWELGGTEGFGGQKHIEKVVGGYDVMRELPRLGEAYAGITPWEDSHTAKVIAGLIPLGVAVLMEPDAISLGTGLIGAPVAKMAKAVKTGKYALKLLDASAEAWELALKGGAEIEDVAKLAGTQGSAGWLGFNAVKGDLLARGVQDAPELAKINPDDLTGLPQAVARAAKELADADADVTAAAGKVAAGQQAIPQIGADAAAKLADIGRRHVEPLLKEAPVVAAELARTEADFLRAMRLTSNGAGFAAPRPAARVLSDLARLKAQRAKLVKDLQAAEAAGDAAKVTQLEDAIANLKLPYLQNAVELLTDNATHAYTAARKAVADHGVRLAKARAEVQALQTAAGAARVGGKSGAAVARLHAQTAARMAKAHAALTDAVRASQDALDLRKVAQRQADQLGRMKQDMLGVVQDFRKGIRFSLDAIEKGTSEATDLGRAAIQDLAVQKGTRFQFDGAKYYAHLVQKYGADAVQGALDSPAGTWAPKFLTGGHSVTTPVMGRLRKLEEGMHSLAEQRRLAPGASARRVLQTVGESPLARGWSADTWAAWTYQVASRLGRNADRITASVIGKAPRAVQHIVRRAYGRYHSTELELDKVAGQGGIAAMREFLTTMTDRFGTVSNRDTISIADKALTYLRALANGSPEAWEGDAIVDALSRAPLPSWFSGHRPAGNAKAALKAYLTRPGLSGVQLVDWLEKVPAGIFTRQLGTADASQVQFRFIARALVHSANQHDAMFDLMRLGGPQIDGKAARALNFMISRNANDLEELAGATARDAERVADLYGLPYLSHTAGKLKHLFAANRESVKLMHVATIEGKEHWIPATLWKAMNEIPFKLSKELAEVSEQPSWLASNFDRMSRLWRIATVNGYVLPRAAHFTNTLFGDWSQMVQVLGWRAGTRLALQSVPTYVPFVGTKIQDRLFGTNSSLLTGMFNPTVGKILEASDRTIIDVAEGPLTARRFLQEAFEDGCWDSISTRDLQEATARHGMSWWKRLGHGDPPPWIERSAKMMEELQMRNRLALYTELRNGGMAREAARAQLNRALYDWSTGVPEWEMGSISRVAAFWTYRRSMMRGLGASLAEGFTSPQFEFVSKALTGRTEVARMRQTAELANAIPEAIYWEDPDEPIDDAEQYRRYALASAPWWVKAQAIIANRGIDPERQLWYSEVAGRKVTYESLMLPALTTLDQLYLLNNFVQTAMASTVLAAEKAGLKPSMTTIDAREIWERNVDGFAETLMPGFDEAAGNMLRGTFGRSQYSDPRGVLVPQAQAVILHRCGFDSFMAAHPDADGSWRIDPGAYGLATSLLMSFPPAADIARNWNIFADNPGYTDGVTAGLTEALQRWVGFKPAGFDPANQRDHEVEAQARQMKEEASGLRKQLEPRNKY